MESTGTYDATAESTTPAMSEFLLNEEELYREDDEASPLTSLHPWWKFDCENKTFGAFMEPKVEAAYRRWHHKMWLPRIRILFVMGTIVFLGGFAFQSISRPGSMKAILMRMHQDSTLPLLATSIISRTVSPIYAFIVCLPCSQKHVTPERYQSFVTSAFVMAFVIEQAMPFFGTYPYFTVPERTDRNAEAWSDVDAWASEPKIHVRQTFWHAVISDAWYICIGALSGLRPQIVVLLGIVLTIVFQTQFQNTYVSLDMLRVGIDGAHSGGIHTQPCSNS